MSADKKTVTDNNRWEKRLLIGAIVVPIAIAIIVAGVPVIWKALTTIRQTLIPNIWVLFGYLYIAVFCILVGRITKK